MVAGVQMTKLPEKELDDHVLLKYEVRKWNQLYILIQLLRDTLISVILPYLLQLAVIKVEKRSSQNRLDNTFASPVAYFQIHI